MNIALLDCTLRDGAYVNNGHFGDDTIKAIISNLNKAQVEIIEVGWLKNSDYLANLTYYKTPNDIKKHLDKKTNVTYLAMVDYGRYDLSNLPKFDNTSIDGIRIAFSKQNLDNVIEYASKIKEKGYKVFLQASNSLEYSNDELLKLSEYANKLKPECVSIVDTFGAMYFDDLERIFKVLNKNLDKNIKIGFHSHNNLQLSFALSIRFVELTKNVDRNFVLDSSLMGMGRGAGNTNSELIINYLNEKHNCSYDYSLIINVIDKYILPFYKNQAWGYSVPCAIAGQMISHINNIKYLKEKHSATCAQIKGTLDNIPLGQRKFYDYDVLENAYLKVK